MKIHSLLSSRAFTLGLIALLLPAARAAEPAAPAVGALTLEASPAAHLFALPAPAPAASGPAAPTPNAGPAPSVTYGSNLLTNPGFETGNLTGYTTRGSSGAFLGPQTLTPHTGTYECYFGKPNNNAGYYTAQETLTQTVPTTNGGSYLVSFYLNDRGLNHTTGGTTFDVTFGGTSVLTTSGIVDTNGYVQYSAVVTATAASSDLVFSCFNGGVNYLLDDLSVQAAVPEPSTWAGGALLLGATALTLRRRRSAALPG